MFCEYNWCDTRRIFIERNLIVGILYTVVNVQKYSSFVCVCVFKCLCVCVFKCVYVR